MLNALNENVEEGVVTIHSPNGKLKLIMIRRDEQTRDARNTVSGNKTVHNP